MIIKINHDTYINTDKYDVFSISEQKSENFDEEVHCGLSFIGYKNFSSYGDTPDIHIDIYGPKLGSEGMDDARTEFDAYLTNETEFLDIYEEVKSAHEDEEEEF